MTTNQPDADLVSLLCNCLGPARGREHEPGCQGPPLADDLAPYIAEREAAAWDSALKLGEQYERSLWHWQAGATVRAVNGLTERPTRPENPYRAAQHRSKP